MFSSVRLDVMQNRSQRFRPAVADIDLQYPQQQVSAFIPSPPARERFHPTAPTTTTRSVIINNRRSRPRLPAAAAASPAPSEGVSTAQEDGASAKRHEATTPAAATVAEAPSVKADVSEAAEAVEAPPPPPSYRRLYDAAMGLLESEIGLEPYPIPEGLEGNCAVVGKGRNLQVRGDMEIRCTASLVQPVVVSACPLCTLVTGSTFC